MTPNNIVGGCAHIKQRVVGVTSLNSLLGWPDTLLLELAFLRQIVVHSGYAGFESYQLLSLRNVMVL